MGADGSSGCPAPAGPAPGGQAGPTPAAPTPAGPTPAGPTPAGPAQADPAPALGRRLGLGLAGLVAYGNATSSARLAARYPASGGTYVYGRERLGAFWGYLAGWGFVVGKTASCAGMALTIGAYAAPSWQRPIAVVAVVGVTAVNYHGVRKTARMTRLIVA